MQGFMLDMFVLLLQFLQCKLHICEDTLKPVHLRFQGTCGPPTSTVTLVVSPLLPTLKSLHSNIQSFLFEIFQCDRLKQ